MRWSIRIGRLFGIPLFIHITFFMFLAWVGFESYRNGQSAGDALTSVLFMCTLFACVVLHELGHALTARRYGIPTRDITLLPIGGVARLDRMPDDPKQELWVAIAGPAVNVAIAGVLILATKLSSTMFSIGDASMNGFMGGSFLSRVIVVNLFLVLFNMLPAFPMDGVVYRAHSSPPLPYPRATHIAATVGQCGAAFWLSAHALRKPDADLHRALRGLARRRSRAWCRCGIRSPEFR
jgi:Zn-dependent protease